MKGNSPETCDLSRQPRRAHTAGVTLKCHVPMVRLGNCERCGMLRSHASLVEVLRDIHVAPVLSQLPFCQKELLIALL